MREVATLTAAPTMEDEGSHTHTRTHANNPPPSPSSNSHPHWVQVSSEGEKLPIKLLYRPLEGAMLKSNLEPGDRGRRAEGERGEGGRERGSGGEEKRGRENTRREEREKEGEQRGERGKTHREVQIIYKYLF